MITASLSRLAGPAIVGLIATQAAAQSPPTQTDLIISDEVIPFDVEVRPGQVESCSVNPPVLVVRQGSTRIDNDNGLDLHRAAPEGGVVDLVAFGPAGFFKDHLGPDQTAMLRIDSVTIRDGKVESRNGQIWELFDRLHAGQTTLHPKSADFSLCPRRSFSMASAAGNRGRFGALRSSTVSPVEETGLPGLVATASAAASAILDIFGLDRGAWLRVRVSSDPDGANVYLGGSRQATHTNTALDILAAELPHLSLQKRGYEPCPFERWKAVIEPTFKHVLTASCKLTPRVTPAR